MKSGKPRAAVMVAAWSLLADTAVAQTTTAAPVTPPSPMASMLQGMVGLVIVVALILVVAWALKKVGPRARASGIVQVVGGASVGPREKVVVVRFGQQTMLLGVAPGHVALLHMAEPGELAEQDAAHPPAPRFIDRLRAARSDG
jgi:flagellar protein FliO/FliZ